MPHLLRGDLDAEGLEFREGIHAASHALLNIMPLYVHHCNFYSSDLFFVSDLGGPLCI